METSGSMSQRQMDADEPRSAIKSGPSHKPATAQQSGAGEDTPPRQYDSALVRKQVAVFRHIARNLQPDSVKHSTPFDTSCSKPYASMFRQRQKDREFRIASRTSYRINELQNFPQSLPEDVRVSALVELRALRLREFQAKVRDSLIAAAGLEPQEIALRYGALARERRLTIRDPIQTELMEKQRRAKMAEQAELEKQKQLENIIEHAVAFKEFHHNVRKKRQKITRAVAKYHSSKKTKAQQEQERLEKERLRLLMEQDTEGYKRLLDSEKDSRKRFLLDKIDERTRIIEAMVKAHQKAEASQEHVPTAAESQLEAEEGGESSADAASASSLDIHALREPIEKQPSVLVGGTLKHYQMEGLEWLVSLYNNRLNGILADEMGLGKTIQTIALLAYLVEKKNNYGPFLVVVPLPTISNWRLELAKWAPSLHALIYKGNKQERRQLHAEVREAQFNVLVTTYEMVVKDKAVLSKVQWRYLIVDEGHRMKNYQSRLTQTLVTYYRAPRRLLLTGTPLQNNLPELWSLLNFLLPDVFNSCSTFDSWFNAPFAGTGEKLELDEEERQLIILQLHRILRPFLLRRLKKEVETQLPDKVEYAIKCELSALQKRLYKFMKKYRIILTDKPLTQASTQSGAGAQALRNTLMQLRKICNHPYVFQEVEEGMIRHLMKIHGGTYAEHINSVDLWRTSGKFELLDRVLDKLRAADHRVLLFSQFTETLTILEDFMRLKGIRYLRMDGSTSEGDRARMLAEFNEKDSPYELFMLSTRAGGLGLNLQTADTVVIFDSDWNPHQDLQAQDRAHRIGQKNEVRVLRFITRDTVEERILERARFKLGMDKQVIQAGMYNRKATEKDTRAFLMTLLEEEDDVDEEADKAMDDEELNEMLARSEDEFELYQKMDAERSAKDAAWKSDIRQDRLMQSHELPEWVLDDNANVEELLFGEGPEETYGRGHRERKAVQYDDNLTERQFMKAVEAGELPNAVDKASTKRKRRGSKQKDSKRRKSTPKASAAASEAGSEQPDTIQAIFDDIIAYENRHGRVVSETFWDLPDEKQDPEFYDVVKKPLDLRSIKERCDQGEYQTIDELEADITLVVDNAQAYYEDTSDEYKDAEELKEHFYDRRATFMKASPRKSRGRRPQSDGNVFSELD